MDTIFCNIHEGYIKRNKCYLDTDPDVYFSNKSCQACDHYQEIITSKSSKLRISPKPIPVPGKPLVIASEAKRERIKESNLRAKCAWECIRRNKQYRADFKKYGNKDTTQINDTDEDVSVWAVIVGKWGIDGKLPNPDNPQPPNNLFLADPFITTSYPHPCKKILLVPPGTTLINRETKEKIKNKQWLLYDYKHKSHTEITLINCPRVFRLTVDVNPMFKKSDVRRSLLKEFDKAYDTLIRVRETLERRKPKHNRPRYNEINTYLRVYDLKLNMSWPDIAMTIFPEQTTKNTAYARRIKKTERPFPSAIENVKYYWKQANDLINKGGWRRL